LEDGRSSFIHRGGQRPYPDVQRVPRTSSKAKQHLLVAHDVIQKLLMSDTGFGYSLRVGMARTVIIPRNFDLGRARAAVSARG
jgi:hypothetical protein